MESDPEIGIGIVITVAVGAAAPRTFYVPPIGLMAFAAHSAKRKINKLSRIRSVGKLNSRRLHHISSSDFNQA